MSIDIGVNPKQKIKDTLVILSEKGLRMDLEENYVRLERTMERVNILSDYNQSNIFNGDKLIA